MKQTIYLVVGMFSALSARADYFDVGSHLVCSGGGYEIEVQHAFTPDSTLELKGSGGEIEFLGAVQFTSKARSGGCFLVTVFSASLTDERSVSFVVTRGMPRTRCVGEEWTTSYLSTQDPMGRAPSVVTGICEIVND